MNEKYAAQAKELLRDRVHLYYGDVNEMESRIAAALAAAAEDGKQEAQAEAKAKYEWLSNLNAIMKAERDELRAKVKQQTEKD